MTQKQWKSRTASVIIALATLGAINLPQLADTKAIAQTLSVQPLCTETDIKQYIQQLNEFEEFENVNFNALVACNSKAVPALIKALENQDEDFRIITIAALGEIGTKAAPAVPVLNRLLTLNRLLKDKRENIRIVVVYALGKIISKNLEIIESEGGVLPLYNALRDENKDVRSIARNALVEIYGDFWNQGLSLPPVSRQTTALHLKRNPPVMCRIPAIRAVLKWKCP